MCSFNNCIGTTSFHELDNHLGVLMSKGGLHNLGPVFEPQISADKSAARLHSVHLEQW